MNIIQSLLKFTLHFGLFYTAGFDSNFDLLHIFGGFTMHLHVFSIVTHILFMFTFDLFLILVFTIPSEILHMLKGGSWQH